MTLRTRLTVAFLLVVLVPLLVGGLLLSRVLPPAVESRQADGLRTTARATATVVGDYCDRARAAAEAAGRASTGTSSAGATAALQSLVTAGLADGVRVVDGAGRVVGSAGEVPGQAKDCAVGAASPGPSIAGVVQLRTAAGRAGTATAAFRVDRALVDRLAAAVGRGGVALVGPDGALAASSGPVPPAVLAGASARPGSAVKVSGRVVVLMPAAAGRPYGLLLTQPLERGPGVLVVALLIVLGAALLAAAIALLLARATTKPLDDLGDAAARIAGGDLDTTIDVHSRDEVGHLAGAFNAMTEDLRTYVEELRASRDELQQGLTRLGDTLSGTHDLDRILAVVLETAMAATRAEGGMVLLVAPGRDELVLAAQRCLSGRVPSDLLVPVGAGVSGRVAASGEAVMARAGDAGTERAPGEPEAASLIAVPLHRSGTVIGVLNLYDRRGRDGFDEGDLATIRTFAGQATVAVDNVLLHEEAQRLAITDGLTGLWNYRYFTMTVGKEVERASRFGRPLALLMLDLDHFKQVNDAHGHQRGDAVLIELAARVRSEVRDVDTVARYGGEEVVVVLPETTEGGAVHAAERICAAVRRQPFGGSGQEPAVVTVSLGVAVFPTHGATPGALLRSADEALYDAKRAGRDTWRLAGTSGRPPVGVGASH